MVMVGTLAYLVMEVVLAFYYRERENEQRASELVELRRSSERTDEGDRRCCSK
eukprot:COSAG06_NODE_25800_length_628_cov_1.272212_1_plen_53_part_10